ncbi:MAG: hypothetical protein ACOYN3_09145, partial [Acidimicrobiia bacterium]
MDLIWTQYGAPADAALASAIERAQAHDPLAAVHVIAPNRYAALAARHTLARRPRGLINVRCEPLSALAGLLGAPALIAAGKRPLSTARLTAELRRTLRRQPATPATLRAYRRAYTELRNGTPTDLERIAAVSPHAARAVAVFQAVRAVVVERTFDDVDLLEQAAIQIDAHPPSDLGTILWWLPGTTTRAERNLVRALAAALPFVTVSATTGEPDADTATRTSLAAVYGSLPSTEPPE